MDLDNLKILIVEDDENHGELLYRGLKDKNSSCEIKIVTTIRQAKSELDEFKPHILITDWRLPDGYGVEFLEQLQELDIPIIVMTSYGNEGLAVESIKKGALDYIVKSNETLSDIYRIVVRVLREWDNIIHLRHTEEALRESEKKYRELTELLPQAVFECDIQGKITFANRQAYKMFGYNYIEQPLNMNIYDMLSQEDIKRGQENFQKRLRKDIFSGVEYTAKRKDGSTFPILAYVSVIEHQNNPTGLRGIIVDITEHKRAQEELEQNHALLQALIKNLPFDFWARDSNDKMILQSDQSIHNWGELMGKNPDFFEINENAGNRLKENNLIAKSGSVVQCEIEYELKGENRFFHNIVAPLWRDGQVAGTLGINIDITEHKKVEEDRRKLEQQMQHAQKLESLGILAGGIAHDFNNILMAILGNVDIALMDLLPSSPVRPRMLDIEKASKRAADLCRQMLAYAGKGRFVIQPMNISEIIKDMSHMLEVSISKKISISYNISHRLPLIKADVAQMQQVIMNLIINASEAIGDREGVISLATGVMKCDSSYLSNGYLNEKLPEGMYVYLEVSDNGCGMDKNTQAKIFDPFFTTKFTGRGLGLASVLGIIRGHKGLIKVDSEPGKGTKFKILIPAMVKSGEKIEKNSDHLLELKGHGTILLVDDEPMICHVAREMLLRMGFKVITADNGMEAIKIFTENLLLEEASEDRIICVILDLTMPRMEGEETFRELRRIRNDIPVILASGYNGQEVIRKFVGKGLAGFIQKPYKMRTITEKLKEVLKI